jgi:hypothetical protein
MTSQKVCKARRDEIFDLPLEFARHFSHLIPSPHSGSGWPSRRGLTWKGRLTLEQVAAQGADLGVRHRGRIQARRLPVILKPATLDPSAPPSFSIYPSSSI